MKKKHIWMLLILVVAVVALVLSFKSKGRTCIVCEAVATNTPRYSDSDYGFSIQIPEGTATTTDFKSFYHLPALWRSGASPSDTDGDQILGIIITRLENRTAYPRYFNTEVRIGASTEATALEHCFDNNQSYKKIGVQEVQLGDTTFQKFDIANAGMMQYLHGESYRTKKNGACFAVEVLRTGSSYKEEGSLADIDEETLDASYEAAKDILETFRFEDETSFIETLKEIDWMK